MNVYESSILGTEISSSRFVILLAQLSHCIEVRYLHWLKPSLGRGQHKCQLICIASPRWVKRLGGDGGLSYYKVLFTATCLGLR